MIVDIQEVFGPSLAIKSSLVRMLIDSDLLQPINNLHFYLDHGSMDFQMFFWMIILVCYLIYGGPARFALIQFQGDSYDY